MKLLMQVLGMIGLMMFGGWFCVLNVDAEELGVEVTEDGVMEDIFIKAINPGYVIDKKSNVGEMIEIARKSSDTPILLAGATVGYTNSNGNYTVLLEFPENSWMTGENILLRLASSPENELAAMNYTKTLAFKGGLEIRRGEKVIDEVCWTGGDGCYDEFKSSNPTTLVLNLETNKFEHKVEYVAKYDASSYYVEAMKDEVGYGGEGGQCKNVRFTEILSYYESSSGEQFIEFYNGGTEAVALEGCQIWYKNKSYKLSGMLLPEAYYAYYPEEFNLTRNPTNNNVLRILDLNGAVVDELIYYNGQRKGTSYAFIGFDEQGGEIWRTTYAPTPGAPNNYQEYKTCEEGKVLNAETGNCVKITSVAEKICGEGQYLNLLTGRCRKYDSDEDKVKGCKEGYYLNEETGRCRKIQDNTGADYGLGVEEYQENSSFVALYAILGVVGVGLIYVIYEFRHEIGKLFGKVFRRFR